MESVLSKGSKRLSDLYSVGSGTFEIANPSFQKSAAILADDPYGEGWLYEFTGEPDTRRLDATAYKELLGVTINRLHAERCPDVPE